MPQPRFTPVKELIDILFESTGYKLSEAPAQRL
jgi:hypothetical protein